ncbi:hypothetical protein ASZ78_000723 [Callipepla squamata]|uniref:IFNL3 protein n=1 Tax=Callipepla squamata TaxID=9009 RepID=A0A226N2H9_CALSU|nr:hypothetical protein ASZ78_000723 [Callipepla squamata]
MNSVLVLDSSRVKGVVQCTPKPKSSFPICPHSLVFQLQEDIMLLTNRKCNTRLFHRKWNTAELSVPDRITLVEAELDLTIAMLTEPTTQRLAETCQQPLAFLTQVREDLRDCLSVEAPSHQPSGKLRHWLQKLETAKKKETTGCLQASAILHIFQVLNDLRCAAQREDCT